MTAAAVFSRTVPKQKPRKPTLFGGVVLSEGTRSGRRRWNKETLKVSIL